MRKSTKLAILVAALVALCSIAALAAETWKQEGDNWYCYDKDGNMIYGEWKKSGSNWYYLDDATGVMVKNQLVDNGGEDVYYAGEDGARVIGKWQKVAVENNDAGDGYEWMYFKTITGKAQKGDGNKLYTINGKKYMFTSDGYMYSGYLTDTLTATSNASEAAWNLGSKDDGSAQTGWVNVKDGADENFAEDASIWFYFDKGAKKTAASKINGNKYYFDNNKYYVMLAGWTNATVVDASANWYYLGGDDDGKMQKSQWIKTAKDFGPEDGETSYWYYLTSSGKRQAAGVAKINSKYYLFDANQHMVSGIAVGTYTTDKNSSANFVYSATATTYAKKSLDNYKALPANAEIMFFSADADTDGSMKVGTQTITIDGEEATIVLDKHGFALEGYKNKKIYTNGILQAAGSSKVAVKKLRVASEDKAAGYYLVNASGSLLTKTMTTDSDGIYWVGKADREIYKFADTEYAAQAAKAVKAAETAPVVGTVVEFTVTEDGTKWVYRLTFKDKVDSANAHQYYDVTWAKNRKAD